jgi:hypothetical protein
VPRSGTVVRSLGASRVQSLTGLTSIGQKLERLLMKIIYNVKATDTNESVSYLKPNQLHTVSKICDDFDSITITKEAWSKNKYDLHFSNKSN